MSNDRNSYKSITKAIGLFGGVNVFKTIIGLIRNKIIAVLLGPFGMGISGMITSTTGLVASLTGMGLHTSSVRDVSKAYSSGDKDQVNETVSVLRKLVLFTGMLGTLIVFAFARPLSVWAFKSEEYTLAFRLVSVILFIDQLNIGQTVLLQGTFHYSYMAKSSVLGSLIGLVLTVPLYYIWRIKAIVPVIIITSLISLSLSTFYSRKISYQKVRLSVAQIWSKGKTMLSVGMAIALSGVITTGQVYVLRLVIANQGSIDDVGLYSAGIAIATQYIGVILTSMGSDYSPRLAAVSNDNSLFIDTINRQMQLLTTLVIPLAMAFILLIKPITIILYSNKFLPITGMIEWIMLGMIFRTISWCISYGYVARGDAKLFFWNELLTAVYNLGFSVLGYMYAGFEGLGIAFCMSYLVYSIQLYLLSHKKFGYHLSSELIKTLLPQLLLVVTCFALLKLFGYSILRYTVGSAFVLTLCLVSCRYLNRMINIKEVLTSLKRKIVKKQD